MTCFGYLFLLFSVFFFSVSLHAKSTFTAHCKAGYEKEVPAVDGPVCFDYQNVTRHKLKNLKKDCSFIEGEWIDKKLCQVPKGTPGCQKRSGRSSETTWYIGEVFTLQEVKKSCKKTRAKLIAKGGKFRTIKLYGGSCLQIEAGVKTCHEYGNHIKKKLAEAVAYCSNIKGVWSDKPCQVKKGTLGCKHHLDDAAYMISWSIDPPWTRDIAKIICGGMDRQFTRTKKTISVEMKK